MATGHSCSFYNVSFEHRPFRFDIPSLHSDAREALSEVGFEGFLDRGLPQTFPSYPHYSFWLTRSVQGFPLPPNPTHQQVVISWQLSSSLPSVQNTWSKITQRITRSKKSAYSELLFGAFAQAPVRVFYPALRHREVTLSSTSVNSGA